MTKSLLMTKARFKSRILHAPNRIAELSACKMRRLNQLNATLQFDAGSVEYLTDPVEYSTEVRQLI